jgi:hypothetical protein
MAVIDDYVFARCNDLRSCGGDVVRLRTQDLGRRFTQIRALVRFGRAGRVTLGVRELVEELEGRAHRYAYSYHCACRDCFLFRYDRDPDNHPEMPEHKHLPPDERRVPWGRVTFREVLEETFALVAELERVQEA